MSRCMRSILTSLALLAALGVVLGIGLAVVYADHIYSPYEGLTKLQVIDPAHDASGGFDARFDEPVAPAAAPGLLQEAARWAKASHATLLRQNALGYNVCAASDLLESVVDTDALGPDAAPGAATTRHFSTPTSPTACSSRAGPTCPCSAPLTPP